MKDRYYVVAFVLVIVLVGVWAVSSQPPAPSPSTVSIVAAYVGRPVFIEFMNPACIHCEHMTGIINQLYEQYGGKVVFLSVSSGSVADTQAFINQYGTPWTYSYDANGSVFAEYGVTGTPTFCFVNGQGQVVNTIIGETSLANLQQAMGAII